MVHWPGHRDRLEPLHLCMQLRPCAEKRVEQRGPDGTWQVKAGLGQGSSTPNLRPRPLGQVLPSDAFYLAHRLPTLESLISLGNLIFSFSENSEDVHSGRLLRARLSSLPGPTPACGLSDCHVSQPQCFAHVSFTCLSPLMHVPSLTLRRPLPLEGATYDSAMTTERWPPLSGLPTPVAVLPVASTCWLPSTTPLTSQNLALQDWKDCSRI